MEKEPTVWIVQDDGYKDFRQAEAFGNLKVIFTRDLSLFSDPSPKIHFINKTISKEFDPDNDYLLLVGDPVLIGLVCGSVFRQYGRVNALKWNKQSQSYKSIFLEMGR